MGKIFCAQPASHIAAAVTPATAIDAGAVIVAPFTLYATTEANEGQEEKPRDANCYEVRAYLDWLAERRGIAVPGHAVYQEGGITVNGKVLVAMPGYGQSQTVTCEILDDAGEVTRTMILPPSHKGKGALPMTAAQVQDWSGIEKVRKPRGRKPAAAPVVAEPAAAPAPAPVEAVAAAPVADDVVARLAALEAIVARLSRPVVAGKRVRSEAERRAIIRAWNMRREMRANADLDRRALEAANGAYRGLLDQYATVRDQRDEARDLYERTRNIAARVLDARSRTARRLSTARAATRTARREAIGLETAWRIADAEVQRLAPVAAAIAAISAAAAPPAPTGLRLVEAA